MIKLKRFVCRKLSRLKTKASALEIFLCGRNYYDALSLSTEMTKQGNQVKRPPGRPRAGRHRFNITLTPETSDRLEQAREKKEMTRSAYVELALKDRFKKDRIE